jgi:hypothetical protein
MWSVGDERAETHLRLLAESEARRAARGPGHMPAAEIARSRAVVPVGPVGK